MGRVVVTAAALLAVLAAAGAGSAAGSMTVDPTPVPAEGTAEATATFGEDVEEADVVACRADAAGNVTSCFRGVPMEEAEDGGWTATVPPGGRFGETPQVGFNATGTAADGGVVHVPGEGQRYVFHPVAEAAEEGVPGAGVHAALAGLAAAALAARRRP